MDVEQRLEGFEYWLADMDSALGLFFGSLPGDVRTQLDFTPVSLDVVEGWILGRYPGTQAMLAIGESRIVDGLARYIGETFRKAIGGHWCDVARHWPRSLHSSCPGREGA